MRLAVARFVRIGTLIAITLPYIGASPADSLQQVFARMDQASTQFKGLTADVKKLKHTDVIGEDDVDTGTIAVKVPKPHDFLMLIKFTQPNVKQVGLTTSNAVVFLPKSNSAQRIEFGKKHKALAEQFLRLGFGSNSKDIQDAYSVTLGGAETVAGEKTVRIELIPKSQELKDSFPKFELWISDRMGIAVQQKVYETGGKDYSLATYTKIKLEPNLPDSAVKLDLPKGVKPDIISK
jgi:outer membrane lipoprotein-sorting protein